MIIKGYGIKNKYGGTLLYDFFAYKRDAVAHAKHLISNTKYDWKEIYTIVKVELKEI